MLNINLSFVLEKMFFVFYFFQLKLFSLQALQRKNYNPTVVFLLIAMNTLREAFANGISPRWRFL